MLLLARPRTARSLTPGRRPSPSRTTGVRSVRTNSAQGAQWRALLYPTHSSMSWFSGAASNGSQQPPSLPPRGGGSGPGPAYGNTPQYSSLPTQPRPQPSAAPPRSSRPQPSYGDEKAQPQHRSPRVAPPAVGGGRGGGRFQVVEAPTAGHALTNCLIVNEQDWGGVPYVIIKGQFIYTTRSVSAPSFWSAVRHQLTSAFEQGRPIHPARHNRSSPSGSPVCSTQSAG